MSISPAQTISLGTEPQVTEPLTGSRADLQARARNTIPAFPPGSENVPTTEGQASTNVPAESQLPEDVVQLQRDSQLENELIVRYVDRAGNLILQVPAAQMLDFERAIAAEFQHSKPQAAPSAAKGVRPSGESHGD